MGRKSKRPEQARLFEVHGDSHQAQLSLQKTLDVKSPLAGVSQKGQWSHALPGATLKIKHLTPKDSVLT